MGEQTNQPQASSELNFSPEDFSAEELKIGSEEGAPKADQPVKAEEVQKFKIKYNGKEEEYGVEELTNLAQKGRNYDHVLSERDALKNSEELKTLEQIAKDAGVKDVKTLIENLKKNVSDLKLDERAKKFESEGMTPEHARRMAELEMKAETQAVVEPEAKENPLVDRFTELFDEFPETRDFKTLEDYPEEVQKMIEDGKTPLVAYTKYLTAQKDKELEIAKQNADAKSRDTGSFKSGKHDSKEDDFLKGLLG